MLRYTIIGLVLLALIGCDQGTEPIPPGTVVMSVRMNDPGIVVDKQGRHLDVREMVLRLGMPTAYTTAGKCANGCRIAEGEKEIRIKAGQAVEIGSWEVEDVIERVKISFIPSSGESSLVPEGRTFVVMGLYNSLFAGDSAYYGTFVLPLAIDVDVQLPVTLPKTNEKGAQLELAVDPAEWLYDSKTDRIEPIEDLLGPTPDATVLARVRERLLESLRIHVQ